MAKKSDTKDAKAGEESIIHAETSAEEDLDRPPASFSDSVDFSSLTTGFQDHATRLGRIETLLKEQMATEKRKEEQPLPDPEDDGSFVDVLKRIGAWLDSAV